MGEAKYKEPSCPLFIVKDGLFFKGTGVATGLSLLVTVCTLDPFFEDRAPLYLSLRASATEFFY